MTKTCHYKVCYRDKWGITAVSEDRRTWITLGQPVLFFVLSKISGLDLSRTLPLVLLGFASLCVPLPEMPPLFAAFLHGCFGVSDPCMIHELKRQNNAKDRHEEVKEQIWLVTVWTWIIVVISGKVCKNSMTTRKTERIKKSSGCVLTQCTGWHRLKNKMF